MKYNLYCVRDVKVGFMPPRVDVSDATAIRQFSYDINNNGMMAFTPKDYDLYRVGEFDIESGAINTIVPAFVISGVDVFGDSK